MWCISDFRQACISKTAGRTAKGVKFGPRGEYSVYTGSFSQLSAWGTHFLVLFGAFLIFGKVVSRKRLVVERKGVKFGPRGEYSVTQGILDS